MTYDFFCLLIPDGTGIEKKMPKSQEFNYHRTKLNPKDKVLENGRGEESRLTQEGLPLL